MIGHANLGVDPIVIPQGPQRSRVASGARQQPLAVLERRLDGKGMRKRLPLLDGKLGRPRNRKANLDGLHARLRRRRGERVLLGGLERRQDDEP